MIFDHLENAQRYYAFHPGFKAAFEFLTRTDLASLPLGQTQVNGTQLLAIVLNREGKGKDLAQLEMHHKYIDVQLTLSGTDAIGWKPATACAISGLGLDAGMDVERFQARPDTWIATPPATFAIFYPGEAHAPFGGKGHLHKVVMKVLLRADAD